MKKLSIKTVAVVGTGVIGRSWIQVFARAGCTVRVFDSSPEMIASAMAWFRQDLKSLRARGAIKKKEAKARWDRVTVAENLAVALKGVGYVQESGPERLDLKQEMYRELDRYAPAKAILGSSTSAMDMTAIAEGVPGARRCIVAHPVNPPHVVPAVEILGGAATEKKVVTRTIKFMAEVGQTPILMKKFVGGFVLNRMQAALVREAVDLVASGVCDVRAVDDAIRDGLGLRWALMGPCGVANTNADEGIRQYFTKYGSAYQGIWASLNTNVQFDDGLIDRLGRETDSVMNATLSAQREWRDRLVLGIRELKAATPLAAKRKQQR